MRKMDNFVSYLYQNFYRCPCQLTELNVKQDLHVAVSSVIVVFNISFVADLPGADSVEVVELNVVIIVGTSIVVILVLSDVES